jgi:lipopolysaccharide export system protein LptC
MKNILMTLLILTVASVFVVFWDSPPEIFVREKRTRVEQIPTADSYMRQTLTAKYDKDGERAYTLKASTGLYFSKGDRFELEEPLLVAYRDNGSNPPWRLRADEAHTEKRGGEVVLTGDVYAWQEQPRGINEMRTSRLLFLPETNIARTDRKVALESPGSVTTGTGMEANFDTEVYRLLSNVRGRHNVP